MQVIVNHKFGALRVKVSRGVKLGHSNSGNNIDLRVYTQVLRDVRPYRLVKSRRFGGAWGLHIHGSAVQEKSY